FVARFIGTSNLVDCSVRDSASVGAQAHVKMPDGTTLVGRCTTAVQAGDDVVVCLRAEKIRVRADDAAPDPGAHAWHRAEVTIAAFYGDSREYLIAAFGTTLQVRTSLGQSFAPGSEVRIGFEPGDLIVIGAG